MGTSWRYVYISYWKAMYMTAEIGPDPSNKWFGPDKFVKKPIVIRQVSLGPQASVALQKLDCLYAVVRVGTIFWRVLAIFLLSFKWPLSCFIFFFGLKFFFCFTMLISFQMYTQYVNGYDKAMSVFQDTMKENSEFENLVSQFQVGDIKNLSWLFCTAWPDCTNHQMSTIGCFCFTLNLREIP